MFWSICDILRYPDSSSDIRRMSWNILRHSRVLLIFRHPGDNMLIYLETSWNILIYSEILSGYPDLSWDILRHPEDILRYLRIFWSNPRYPNLAWDIPRISWDIPRISWDFRSIMFWSICDILRYPDSSWDIRRMSWNILRHSRVLLIFRHPGDNILIYLETS